MRYINVQDGRDRKVHCVTSFLSFKNIMKSIEKKHSRLRQLKELHILIKPFVADSAAIFQQSYTAVEELARGIREKFTLKLDELNTVEEQVNLLNNLLNGVFQQIQHAVECADDLLTVENINVSRSTQLHRLEVRNYSILSS